MLEIQLLLEIPNFKFSIKPFGSSELRHGYRQTRPPSPCIIPSHYVLYTSVTYWSNRSLIRFRVAYHCSVSQLPWEWSLYGETVSCIYEAKESDGFVVSLNVKKLCQTAQKVSFHWCIQHRTFLGTDVHMPQINGNCRARKGKLSRYQVVHG
jgi:hypothetical protein